MNYYYIITDLILPITFLLMPLFSKIAIKKGINGLIGFRTGKSMKNKVNWEKANSLLGKYSLCLGIFSVILTLVIWIIKPYS
ncbi:MAG: SdpI family protein, partial [Eubacteriales bacterium]|nr:SdpI family protein [Eubacteriales bacterium]